MTPQEIYEIELIIKYNNQPLHDARLISKLLASWRERGKQVARLMKWSNDLLVETQCLRRTEEKARVEVASLRRQLEEARSQTFAEISAQLIASTAEVERLRDLIVAYKSDGRSPFPIVNLWKEGDRIRAIREKGE